MRLSAPCPPFGRIRRGELLAPPLQALVSIASKGVDPAWTALCPQSSFERKVGESRCANGYRDYRSMRGRIIGIDVMTVQYRWPLGMPLVRKLGSALWEIRSALPTRIARTSFFVHEEEIVLLHGFIKKTRKTPTEDRALALQRKNAYLKTS